MVFGATNSNTIIDGNVVGQEIAYNGVTSTTYLYDSCLYLGANANVTNNHFSGVTSNSSTTKMVQIINASGNFTGNTFSRGSSNINAFLYASGLLNQNIVDNAFDGYTVDGSSEILVQGLTSNSVFTRNKNQIEYIAASIIDKAMDLSSNAFFDTVLSGIQQSGAGLVRHTGPFITYSISAAAQTNGLNISIDLSSVLPKGITLLQCKIGLFAINGGGAILANSASATGNQWTGSINSYSVVSANYSSGTNSILDPQNNISLINETVSFFYDPITPFNSGTLTTSPNYQTLTPITQSYFINNDLNSLKAYLFLNLRCNATIGGGVTARISPLVCKCIW